MNGILDRIGEWITSVGGITIIITFCFTIFSKVFMAIVRQTIAFRDKLISRDEWVKEKRLMEDRLLAMKTEIIEECKTILMAEIRVSLKDFNDIKATVSKNANVDKLIDEKIKHLNSGFNKLDQLSAKLVYLERRVNLLDNQTPGDPLRRKDNL